MATTKTTTPRKTAARKTSTKAASAEDALDIDIPIAAPKALTVGLGGERYTVRPIKGALGIALGSKLQGVKNDAAKLQKALTDVVQVIFGTEDAPSVLARLEDPADALDYEHIMGLMNKLVERSTGNPTT